MFSLPNACHVRKTDEMNFFTAKLYYIDYVELFVELELEVLLFTTFNTKIDQITYMYSFLNFKR